MSKTKTIDPRTTRKYVETYRWIARWEFFSEGYKVTGCDGRYVTLEPILHAEDFSFRYIPQSEMEMNGANYFHWEIVERMGPVLKLALKKRVTVVKTKQVPVTIAGETIMVTRRVVETIEA